MDALTLDSLICQLEESVNTSKCPENAGAFAAEFNRLLDAAKAVFATEAYVQSFKPIQETVASADEKTAERELGRLLEKIKMKLGLLKAYVASNVASEKKKTHVY